MSDKEALICSECGSVMNHHADKIDHSVEGDPAFGGAVQEVHTCPHCGHIQLRKA